MGRTKERPKLIHQASTLEYLYSLGDMPKWSELLYEQTNGKQYNDFLKWILSKDYFKDDQKISIKKIAEVSGYASNKITKWLREIYDDIFELNEAKPELFKLGGDNKVEFYFRDGDNYCMFKISLATLPREYETFDFFFVKARIGTSLFWVKDVGHYVTENGISVSISLRGGLPNIYREFALSKALFEGTLKFMDVYQKRDFEIDEKLLEIR